MKHVLLPIDGSTRSLRTIDMVQQTYRPQDTEVTLLMVLPDQMHIDGQFARDRMARKARPGAGNLRRPAARLDSPHRTAVGQPRPGNRLLRPGAGF